MIKHVILCIVLCFNTMYGDDQNSYKASELELFLFKIGFESLQNDVKSNSEKTKLNEEDIIDLKNKISLIMDKVYQDELTLEKNDKHYNNISEIQQLKEEILFLKQEIATLKGSKIQPKSIVPIENDIELQDKKEQYSFIVKMDEANVRDNPTASAKLLYTIPKNTIIEIEECDKFGWCKILNKNEYIAQFAFKKMLQ